MPASVLKPTLCFWGWFKNDFSETDEQPKRNRSINSDKMISIDLRFNINLTSFSWAKSHLLIGIVESSRMLPLRAWLLSWTGRQVILCMLIAKQNNRRGLPGLFSPVAILKVPCVLQWPCISMTGVWARLCFSNIEMSWHIIMQSRYLSVHIIQLPFLFWGQKRRIALK